ncbi:MAG TPA: type II toxin-antitoxin system RelE/ParE family toxin [Rhodospirillaceae bacterium]|nr:type II toxin-antitoxin system RelE/ParE family toxin [Rhodospirillaceae bacterium]
MTAYRVTNAARSDFKSILKETRERFGTGQREVYRQLISKAVKMVVGEPERGGSWDRGAVVPGLRAFHLEHAAGRSGAATQALYYALERSSDGSPCVVILRLLHDSMEPKYHIVRTGLYRRSAK